METYLAQGKIIKIGSTEQVTEKFRKREFAITTNEQYPQKLKFDLINNNVDYLDDFNIGDDIKISFLVKGNEYKDKIYINLTAVAIGLIEDESKPAKPRKVQETKVETIDNDDFDDLPF